MKCDECECSTDAYGDPIVSEGDLDALVEAKEAYEDGYEVGYGDGYLDGLAAVRDALDDLETT